MLTKTFAKDSHEGLTRATGYKLLTTCKVGVLKIRVVLDCL